MFKVCDEQRHPAHGSRRESKNTRFAEEIERVNTRPRNRNKEVGSRESGLVSRES